MRGCVGVGFGVCGVGVWVFWSEGVQNGLDQFIPRSINWPRSFYTRGLNWPRLA